MSVASPGAETAGSAALVPPPTSENVADCFLIPASMAVERLWNGLPEPTGVGVVAGAGGEGSRRPAVVKSAAQLAARCPRSKVPG